MMKREGRWKWAIAGVIAAAVAYVLFAVCLVWGEELRRQEYERGVSYSIPEDFVLAGVPVRVSGSFPITGAQLDAVIVQMSKRLDARDWLPSVDMWGWAFRRKYSISRLEVGPGGSFWQSRFNGKLKSGRSYFILRYETEPRFWPFTLGPQRSPLTVKRVPKSALKN